MMEWWMVQSLGIDKSVSHSNATSAPLTLPSPLACEGREWPQAG
jgi:hypothetical protein